MRWLNRRILGGVAVAVLIFPCPAAWADVFGDVGLALSYAGFDLEGRKNHLSGGLDMSLNQNFVGNPIDFGAYELTLRGPVSLDVSTGGRLIPQFDVDLSIDLTGSTALGLPGYESNFDIGAQSSHVEGSLSVDAGFSINRLGFYDVNLTYSSRQDVERDGMLVEGDQSSDFDLGPINLSGNVYLDVLAVVTQPIFDQTGGTNPFTLYRTGPTLSGALAGATDNLQTLLADGGDAAAKQQVAISQAAYDSGSVVAEVFSPHSNQAGTSGVESASAPVPEPTVLVLMALAIPAFVRRRNCRRS